jgi:5-methylcytosine-specific restriction protein A
MAIRNKVVRPWQSTQPRVYKTKSGRSDKDTSDPFYTTPRWRRFRQLYLSSHPLCRHCELIGKLNASTIVDHIKPRSQGGADYDEDNMQALCKSCHTRKTQKDIYKYKKNPPNI